MTDEPKRKGPAFEKPKEPEAVPSKTAQKPLEVKPAIKPVEQKPEVSGTRERPRAADPVVTSKEKPRVADANVASTTTQKPRAAFAEPSLAVVDGLDCEALAICLCSDVRPLAGIAGYVDWRMCGRISDLLRKGTVTGAAREKVLVPTLGLIGGANGPKRIFLFGWGPQRSILDGATERLAWMVDVLLRAKVERVAVALPEPAVVLLGLVDEHVRKPLGDKCAVVFGPDQLLVDAKDTRPIPAPI